MLRSVGEQSAARLREAGESLVTRDMQTLRGMESCLTGSHFGAGHETYHCGQLATYARAMGREPALTQKINAHAGAAGGVAGDHCADRLIPSQSPRIRWRGLLPPPRLAALWLTW
jgi:hypothetical protein